MLSLHHRYGKLAAAISATLYATTGLVAVASDAYAQDAPAEEEIAPAEAGAAVPRRRCHDRDGRPSPWIGSCEHPDDHVRALVDLTLD